MGWWEPVRLSHLKPLFLNNNEISLANNQDVWHKFIIFDVENIKMETIIDSILSLLNNGELFLTMMYQIDDNNRGIFLCKCSVTAVKILIDNGLQITLKDGYILKMDIILGYIYNIQLDFNPNKLITDILISRWDSIKKALNLNDFENDKRLNTIYCPLSSPGIFDFILKLFKSKISNQRDSTLRLVRELILSNNKLIGVNNIHEKFGYNLTKIDLSYNNIDDINYLMYFSEFKITELILNGNPFCDQFDTPEDYIETVKKIFPHIQKLDGIIIDTDNKNLQLTQPYYLADGTKINIIKQFIKHYFTLFDQRDRSSLTGIYDDNAYFSATFGEIANPRHRQLTKILNINRNLLKVVDYSRAHKYLLGNSEEIIHCLRCLPPTYHDYKNYTIDILHQGHKHIAFNIQGPFFYKEFPISLFFNRTFIIQQKIDNEYCIINDQYHIQSGNATMLNNSNNISNNNIKFGLNYEPFFKPTLFSCNEKKNIIKILSNITCMNNYYSKLFLEKADWNLKLAVQIFMKAYSVNDIPPKAFSINN